MRSCTGSIEHPQIESCAWLQSSVRHAWSSAGRSSASPSACANAAHGSAQAVSSVSTARLRSFSGMRADHTPGNRFDDAGADELARPLGERRRIGEPRPRLRRAARARAPISAATSAVDVSARQVVEPVHQQHGVAARGDDPVDHGPQARDGCREVAVGVEPARGEVALGQLPGAHRRAVGRAPPVERTELVELGAVAAPVDERIEAEARRGAAGAARDGRTSRARSRPPTPARARPRPRGRCSRLRTCVSPAGNSESGCTYHGPAASRPACESGDELVAPVAAAPRGSPRARSPARRARSGSPDRPPSRSSTASTASTSRPRNTSNEPVPLPVPVEVGDEQELGRHTEMT